MDSLHEHLNLPSGSRKQTIGDHNQSFSLSESSDLDDDIACIENSLLADTTSTNDESLGGFLSRNEQLLLGEIGAEDSSGFADGDANLLPPLNCTALDYTANQQCTVSTDDVCSVAVDESGRKVPSIEDFWSKDTKTLNTNVLIAETTEELATDSEKFHKVENTAERGAASAAESLDDAVTGSDQLHELLLASCDGSVGKPVKETNLLANCREKFADAMKAPCSVAAYALTSATDVDCFISTMKQFCGRPAGVMWPTTVVEPADFVDNYDNINNIKRVKIDDQAEKNLRMQAKLKVNTEQNQTRLPSLPIADCTAANAIPADQLIANSSSSAAVSAASPQLLRSSAMLCSSEVIAARHMQRAEQAWRAYTSQNRSVIVDTFQGQFKSTVSNFASYDVA